MNGEIGIQEAWSRRLIPGWNPKRSRATLSMKMLRRKPLTRRVLHLDIRGVEDDWLERG